VYYFRRLGIPLIAIFTRAARETSLSNGYGPLSKESWTPLLYTF